MCLNDFGIKVVLYDLGWPLCHTSFYEKDFLHNVDKPEIFFKRLGVKQNTFPIIRWFWNLRWPFVTFNELWGHTLFNIKSA